MKKTINKKVYDTESAKEIGKQIVGYFGDSYGFEEILYCKSNGEYFLFATGGSDSQYPESVIIPMSDSDSEEWVLRVCGGAYADQIFNNVAAAKKAPAKKAAAPKAATKAAAPAAKKTAAKAAPAKKAPAAKAAPAAKKTVTKAAAPAAKSAEVKASTPAAPIAAPVAATAAPAKKAPAAKKTAAKTDSKKK